MKNLFHASVYQTSLFQPARLAFVGEAPKPQEAAQAPKVETAAPNPEQQAAQAKEQAHQQALKDMEAAKNDPVKLAEAYNKARQAQEAMYSGKNRAAIDDGAKNLDAMLTSMGVSKEEAKDIRDQYKSAFESGWLNKTNDVQAALHAASKEQAEKELLPKYKIDALAQKTAVLQPQIDNYTRAIAADEANIKLQKGYISGSESFESMYADRLDKAQDNLKGFLSKANLESSGGKLGKEKFTDAAKASLDEDFPDADAIAKRIDAMYKKYEGLFNAVAAAQKDVDDNKSSKVIAKRALDDAEASLTRNGLLLRAAQTALKDDTNAINNGTFVGTDGFSLNDRAMMNAVANQEDYAAEKAVLKQYADAMQAKSNKLIQKIVIARLDSFKKNQELAIKVHTRNIAKYEKTYDKKIADVEAKARAKLDKWGVGSKVAIDAPDQIKPALEKFVRAKQTAKANGLYDVTDADVNGEIGRALKGIDGIVKERNGLIDAKAADSSIKAEKALIAQAENSIKAVDQAVASFNPVEAPKKEVQIA